MNAPLRFLPVNLDALLVAARATEQAVGHELPSSLYRAGGRSVPRPQDAT